MNSEPINSDCVRFKSKFNVLEIRRKENLPCKRTAHSV